MENILESICHEAFQLVLNLLLLFFNLLLLLLDRYFHSALLRLKPAHQNVDKLTRVAPLQVDALDESKFVYGNLLHDQVYNERGSADHPANHLFRTR